MVSYRIWKAKLQTALDSNDDIEWITVKGNHIPIKPGQNKEDAIREFLESKKDSTSKSESDLSKKGIAGIDFPSESPVYLNVPYSRKDEAKAMGAKWDPDKKSWYIPAGVYNKEFSTYMKSLKEQSLAFSKAETKANRAQLADEIDKPLQDGYKAIKETDKAYRLEKDGVQFWVPKKYVRADGSLTPGVHKAYDNAKEMKQFRDADKERIAKLEENGVPFKPSWESDKAVGVDVEVDWYDIEKDTKVRVFFPKSAINDKGNIPYWLVQKKLDEMYDNLDSEKSRRGGYAIKIPGLDFGRAEDGTDRPLLYFIDGEFYIKK